jgi:hypothetical protein
MEPRYLLDTNTIDGQRIFERRVQQNRATREVWRSLQRRSSRSNKSRRSWWCFPFLSPRDISTSGSCERSWNQQDR